MRNGNWTLRIIEQSMLVFRHGDWVFGIKTEGKNIVFALFQNGKEMERSAVKGKYITARVILQATEWANTHIASMIEADEDERKGSRGE